MDDHFEPWRKQGFICKPFAGERGDGDRFVSEFLDAAAAKKADDDWTMVDVSQRRLGVPYSPSRVPYSGGRFRGDRARFRGDRAGAAPGTRGGATWDPYSGARVDQGPPTRPTRVG